MNWCVVKTDPAWSVASLPFLSGPKLGRVTGDTCGPIPSNAAIEAAHEIVVPAPSRADVERQGQEQVARPRASRFRLSPARYAGQVAVRRRVRRAAGRGASLGSLWSVDIMPVAVAGPPAPPGTACPSQCQAALLVARLQRSILLIPPLTSDLDSNGKPTMDENPYKPSAGEVSPVTGRFRIGIVLMVVALFALYVAGPLIWQAFREARARHRVRQNMEQLGAALEAYQQRQRQPMAIDPDKDEPGLPARPARAGGER